LAQEVGYARSNLVNRVAEFRLGSIVVHASGVLIEELVDAVGFCERADGPGRHGHINLFQVTFRVIIFVKLLLVRQLVRPRCLVVSVVCDPNKIVTLKLLLRLSVSTNFNPSRP
jgi:hypothetical protein